MYSSGKQCSCAGRDEIEEGGLFPGVSGAYICSLLCRSFLQLSSPFPFYFFRFFFFFSISTTLCTEFWLDLRIRTHTHTHIRRFACYSPPLLERVPCRLVPALPYESIVERKVLSHQILGSVSNPRTFSRTAITFSLFSYLLLPQYCHRNLK